MRDGVFDDAVILVDGKLMPLQGMSRSRTSLSISQRMAALREKEPSDTPTRDTWQTTDMRHHDKHQMPVYSIVYTPEPPHDCHLLSLMTLFQPTPLSSL